jgi:hypothetical protein
MALTGEEMTAAAAARRMLDDPHFNGILDHIVKEAAAKAVFNDDAADREANRQLVLAINRVRGQLQANADAPEADKAQEQLARAME